MTVPDREYQKALDVIAEARVEIKRLKAIVAKLPVTADGVPVLPGETYYCCFENTEDGDKWTVMECRYVGHASPHVDYDWEIPGWPWDGCNSPPGFAVYSTRAAAAAAGGE